MAAEDVGKPTYKITVPDEKHIVILYWVDVAASYIGEEVATVNKANYFYSGKLYTKNSGSVSYDFIINGASSGLFTGPYLTLNKTDLSGTPLQYAKYAMYKVDGDNVTKYMDGTTDASGNICFSHRTGASGDPISYDTLYYLVETEAPDGYALDTTRYYFVFRGSENRVVTEAPGGSDLHELITGATVNLTDEGMITVDKTWSDSEDIDGHRPDSITIRLKKVTSDENSTETIYEEVDHKTVEPDADGNWPTCTFTGLALYDEDGNPIQYVVTEDEIKQGDTVLYTSEVTKSDTYTKDDNGNKPTKYTIENSHTPEKRDINVTKLWNDNKNQDNVRPSTVKVQLYADNVMVDGKTIYLTADENGNWSGKFTDLLQYNDGKLINYSVKEADVDTNYDSEPAIIGDQAHGFTITNSHTLQTTSVKVTKTWNDANNQDGLRPTSITVVLKADGEKVNSADLSDDNNWTYTFEDLLKNRTDEVGKAIEYTVVEEGVSTDDYTSVTTGNQTDGYEITNSHDLLTTSVNVTKTWNDAKDQDNYRPESIIVRLYEVDADGNKTRATDADSNEVEDITLTADEDGNWSGSFDNLFVYKPGSVGTKVQYTVEEIGTPEHYKEATVDKKSDYEFEITNSHDLDTTEVSVTKKWNDNNDQDGLRPQDVTVTLLANGKPVKDAAGNDVQPAKLTENQNGDWTYTFTNLFVNEPEKSGAAYEYTVVEAPGDENTSSDIPKGYSVESIEGTAADGYTITNKHVPAVMSVTAEKTWDDADDQDGIRPTSVTVFLLADGEYVPIDATDDGSEANQGDAVVLSDDGDQETTVEQDAYEYKLEHYKSVTLNDDNNWTASFTDLPVYRDHGTEIVYTLEEVKIDGYESTIDLVTDTENNEEATEGNDGADVDSTEGDGADNSDAADNNTSDENTMTVFEDPSEGEKGGRTLTRTMVITVTTATMAMINLQYM
jgi:hypothetical protein